MSKWEKVKLNDVIFKIVGGGTPSKLNPDYWNGSLPWASVKDFPESKYYLDCTEDLITEEGLKSSSSNLIPKGTILLPTRMGLGRVVKTKIDLAINQDLKAIYPNSKISNDYLLWLLVHSGTKLKVLGNGSTVSGIRLDDLKNLEVKIPDLRTQTRIASILSSYDDLIENNEKRIKILEEMAMRLYREWFVKFKFPGHEKVKMVDSGTEYGMVPEGWEVKSLKDVADLTMGQSPTSNNYNLEYKGLPFHQGVADFGYRYPVDRVFSTSGNKFADRNDLLFSVRAPVGRMNISTKKIILGRGLSAIRHKKNFQSLLCLMFANKFRSKDMIGNGAIYKSVNKTELENLSFIKPKDNISEIFESIVSNYFQEMEKISALNTNLSKTRDLLIPQLVTGRRKVTTYIA